MFYDWVIYQQSKSSQSITFLNISLFRKSQNV